MHLADFYLEALQKHPDLFGDASLVEKILEHMGRYQLADEDLDILLCLAHLMGRNQASGGPKTWREPVPYQAVFVDEVQDFTEQQVFLMVEQANPKYRAVTVVGDLAQKLHHGRHIDLPSCFPGQSVPHISLTENMRQADVPGLALFSACFRAALQGGAPPSQQLIDHARSEGDALIAPLVHTLGSSEELDRFIVETLASAAPRQTVAVLFPDSVRAAHTYERVQHRLKERMVDAELSERVNLSRRFIRHFADISNAKGLEFDLVVLADVDGYDLQDPYYINRLYVGITRARQALVLASSTGLPEKLRVIHDQYRATVHNAGHARTSEIYA